MASVALIQTIDNGRALWDFSTAHRCGRARLRISIRSAFMRPLGVDFRTAPAIYLALHRDDRNNAKHHPTFGGVPESLILL